MIIKTAKTAHIAIIIHNNGCTATLKNSKLGARLNAKKYSTEQITATKQLDIIFSPLFFSVGKHDADN